MTDRMNAILARVLSQELARQEVWNREDEKNFGPEYGRADVIKEIREFMEENSIKLRKDFYIETLAEMKED